MEVGTPNRIDRLESAFADHEDGNLFVQLADAYREAGEHERALNVLRKGLEKHASFTPGFVLLGRILVEQRRFPEALVTFERVLEIDANNADARVALGEIMHQLKGAGSDAGAGAGAVRVGSSDANPILVSVPVPVLAQVPLTAPVSGAGPVLEAAPTGDELMPWDEPAPRNGSARLQDNAPPHQQQPAAAPVEASALFSDDAFAMIPQDDAPAHDATGIERAQAIITQAGHLDSMAVALADLLVGLLEYRDPFFRGGTSLTRLLASAIAKELGMNAEEVQAIALGTVLRDLGQVPLKGLISKPELGDEGRRRVENHVETALELLASVNLPPMVRDVIRHHHERWDGGGYPDGLVGEAIPLAARIVSVADSFAAMISARPHRLPRRVPAALDDIKAAASKQFDPNVVSVLQRVLQGSDWRGLRFGLRNHLLIVDPDDSRAMVLATKLCSHGYLAEAAFDLVTAQDRFKRSKLAAIIVSADLDGGEITKLVHEIRETVRLAMLPIVVTDTGVSTRVALLEAGADVCLSRGSSFEELKATLEAFLRREGKAAPISQKTGDAAPWSGLQGDIEDFPLGWLLQVLNYDARTAAIFLTTDGDDGVIYVQGGNPRHAQTKTMTGEDAFRKMLKWDKGSFTVDPEGKSEDHTIKVPLMNLLLDQAVKDDHAAFFGSVNT